MIQGLPLFRPTNMSVLIAKSEMFSCEVLENLLEREGFSVLGKATELNDLISKIRTKKPLCVIVENGILGNKIQHLVEGLKTDKNKPKVIVYVNTRDAVNVGGILHENFSGYLHTGDSLNELYKCLKNIHIHPKYYSEGFKCLIRELGIEEIDSSTRMMMKTLSQRENQVFGLIADGMDGIEIAKMLGVSRQTLANQKQSIAKKLGVDSSRQLLKYAINMKQHLHYL